MTAHAFAIKQAGPAFRNHVPLIILGMHRSGTSLFANWLYQCGFNLGDDMLGPGNGNCEGHFEDLDIFRFHKQILRENLLTYKVGKPISLNYSKKTFLQAQTLLNTKMTNDCWGWKEPRTCLMMDLWNQVIPDYNTIVIYRDFTQVVDSFIRRKQKFISGLRNPLYRAAHKIKYVILKHYTVNRLLKVWIEYNRRILENLKQLDRESYLVFSESTLSEVDGFVFSHLQEKWEYANIRYVPVKSVFVPKLFKRVTAKYEFNRALLEKAKKITVELDRFQCETMRFLLF